MPSFLGGDRATSSAASLTFATGTANTSSPRQLPPGHVVQRAAAIGFRIVPDERPTCECKAFIGPEMV